MMHKVGVHWIPVHNRRGDLDYIRRLQPRSVKIVNPDVQQVSDAFQAVPNALFVLRDHALSEQHDDVARDPVGTGIRHARELAAWVNRLMAQARERGLTFPLRERIITPGINEGKVWEMLTEVVLYNTALCEEGTRLGAPMLAGNLSVGWPGNGGIDDAPPDWGPFAPLHDAVLAGPHMLGFHEYFGQQGPEFQIRWWFNRIAQCPWRGPQWKDRMLCGELGMARAYQDAEGRWNLDGGRGWLGLVDDATYVAMLRRALQVYRADERVYDAEIFTTDGNSQHWHSFDTEPLHDLLLTMAQSLVSAPLPATVHVPLVVGPSPQPEPDVKQTPDTWAEFRRCYAFTRRWEGGWADHPADKGGPTMRGITLATYTRWRRAHGQPDPTPDDLRNIPDAEVEAIYFKWYWQASGAAMLAYPANLVRFDTAVLFGVDVTRWYAQEAGDSEYALLGLRLLGHAGSVEDDPSQAVFWDGWRGRVMELRAIVRQARRMG